MNLWIFTTLSRADFQTAFVRFSASYNSHRIANECCCLSTLYLTQRSSYLLWISFHVFNLSEPISVRSLSTSAFCIICPPRLTQSLIRLLFRSLHIFGNVLFGVELIYTRRFFVA